MSENNKKWYTVIHIDKSRVEYEVIMQVKSMGLTELTLSLLRKTYGENLRTLEGKHNTVTDEIKRKFFYC